MVNLTLEDHRFQKLDSLQSSTYDNTSFSKSWTSGGSTVRGIGSLTGKAIKALGNVALYALDNVIIYARVNAMLPNFPHTDAQATNIEGIEEMYDMILEISRPKVYGGSVRRIALILLSTQINRGHTRALEQAMGRWNSIELNVFLHSIASYSVAPEMYDILRNHSARFPVIVNSKMMVVFMCGVARKNRKGCQAVLNVGYFLQFLTIGEGHFSTSQLAEIYRTILHISRRPERQFRNSREMAIDILARSASPLRPSFIKALRLWGVGDLRALVDVVLENTVPPRQLLSGHVTLSILSLLYHIGRYGAQDKRKVFGAGYLDILSRPEIIKYPIERFGNEFEMVLDMLMDPSSHCMERERNQAIDVLLFQIANNQQYIHRLLVRWSTGEIEELLRILIDKLRTIVTSDPNEAYNNITRQLVTFIAKNALSDQRLCEVIIGAGFLNILCTWDEENEDAHALITDILQQEKYALLVKQVASRFI